jgi:protein SCO1/2
MKYALLFAIALTAFTACGPGTASNSTPASTENQKRYDLRGKVVSVDKAAKKAKIEHEDIPGFMEKMTMDFPIHEDWVWEELQPGAEIRAELVVDSTAKDPYWLEKIGIVASAKPGQDLPPVGDSGAQVGNPVPEFSLTNQDGKKISTKAFAGKVYAITFIYARCPLADYCIKMSTNFSDAANLINKDAELKDKLALLSISFDPENDTPAKLKSYGLGYMGKGATELGIWQLAV